MKNNIEKLLKKYFPNKDYNWRRDQMERALFNADISYTYERIDVFILNNFNSKNKINGILLGEFGIRESI